MEQLKHYQTTLISEGAHVTRSNFFAEIIKTWFSLPHKHDTNTSMNVLHNSILSKHDKKQKHINFDPGAWI